MQRLSKPFQKHVAEMQGNEVHEFNELYNGQIMIDAPYTDRVVTFDAMESMLTEMQGVADSVKLTIN